MKRLIYNDGRKGHSGVRGEVLEEDARGMLVQWEDRMSPTWIGFRDRAWMDHITVVEGGGACVS